MRILIVLLLVPLLFSTLISIGNSHGRPCRELWDFFKENNINVKIYDVSKGEGVELYQLIYLMVLQPLGVQPYVPLTVKMEGNKICDVVIGPVKSIKFWENIIKDSCKKTRVFLETRLIATKELVSLPSSEKAKGGARVNLITLLPLMLLDSLNPVGLILASLVFIVGKLKGKLLQFTAAFVIPYTLAHFALSQVLVNAPRWIDVIGIAASLFILATVIKPELIRKSYVEKLSEAFRRRANVVTAAIIGALAGTFAMSPCVVGIFLVLSKLMDFEARAVHLVIYAIPPIAISFIMRKRMVNFRLLIGFLASVSLLLSLYFLLT